MAKSSKEIRLRISGDLLAQVEAYGQVTHPGEPLGVVVREALGFLVGVDPLSAVAASTREAIYRRYSYVARTGLGAALRRLGEELDAEEVHIRQDFFDR